MTGVAVSILLVHGFSVWLSVTLHTRQNRLVSSPVTERAVQLMMLGGICLKFCSLLLVTCTAQGWLDTGTILQECRGVRLVALEAVLILHVRAVRIMTLRTLEELAVNPVACIAIKFGMGTRMEFHLLDRPFVTGGTCGFYVLDL